MPDSRTLPEVAARQIADWDRYAAGVRRDVSRSIQGVQAGSLVSVMADHLLLALDEVDALQHDIRRAYDIANEHLSDAMRLRQQLASADTHPQRGDAKQAPSPMGSAVPKGDAQA